MPCLPLSFLYPTLSSSRYSLLTTHYSPVMFPKPCHRHPSVPVTGFCALCLRDRLAAIPSSPPPDLPRSTLSDLFTRHDAPAPTSQVRVHSPDQTKTVKEFIDLELHRRKRNFAADSRTFWNVATDRFKKWKFKHMSKKNVDDDNNNNNNNSNNNNAEKRRARRLRDTQSEVGERRSCDTDPRFSFDVGRISFDCPRASWDGCLIGKSCSRLSPMTSLDEDSNSDESNNNVVGLDLESSGDGERGFGLNRSNSRRRQSIAGLDELKLMSNGNGNGNGNANAKMSPKVSPAAFYGAKLLITEKELMDSYVRSSSDVVGSDCVIESDSKDVSDMSSKQKDPKKLQKWRGMWNKLGLAQRREDRMECDSGAVPDKPLAESLQRLRSVVNVQAAEPVVPKFMRSYSVSCRSTCKTDAFMENSESKASVLNGRQEFTFQRNRSVRYSPNNPDSGLLRFYLTPTKSYKRSKLPKSTIKDLHSTVRSGF